MAVSSMSKQEFSRVDVPSRVQSGRLRVSDAAVLIGSQRRQVFVCCAASSTVRRACLPSAAADPATTGYPMRSEPQRYRSCGSGIPILARAWRRRAGRASRPNGVARDLARLDDRGRAVAGPSASPPSPHQPRRRANAGPNRCRSTPRSTPGFEDRGPPVHAAGVADDATSRSMELRVVTSELAFDDFRATRAYLEAHGKRWR